MKRPFDSRELWTSLTTFSCLLVFFVVCLLLPARPALGVQAAGIAQGFETTEKNLVIGALVSLRPDKANTVQLANTDRADHLVGVIGENALIEFGDQKNSVQVVTSGISDVLVSDLEGEVKTGDRISPSPINGIGMKTTKSSVTLGVAQGDLTAAKTSEHFITDRNGNVHSIHVGLIPVQIDITYFAAADDASSFLPPAIQDIANNLANKHVPPIRILIALVTLLVGFVSVGILLYAAVRSSIISIGRNPLSEKPVRKGIFQIGLIALGILLFTIIAIYLILTT